MISSLNFNLKKLDFECADSTGMLYIKAFRWLALIMTKSKISLKIDAEMVRKLMKLETESPKRDTGSWIMEPDGNWKPENRDWKLSNGDWYLENCARRPVSGACPASLRRNVWHMPEGPGTPLLKYINRCIYV